MAGSQVRITIYVADEATGQIRAIRGTIDGLSTSPGVKTIQQGFGMGIGLQIFNQGVAALKGAFNDIIGGALADEAAMAKLGQAMQNSGLSMDIYRADVEKAIEANVRLGFTDADTVNSLATLVTATHDVSEAQRFQAAAMDLARLKGISLQEASDALVKVEAGQYRMLKSLGIQLPANASAMDALAAVEKAAGGQAEAFAKTTQGSFTAASAAFDKLGSDIGERLLPVLKSIADAIDGSVLPFMDSFINDGNKLRNAVILLTPILAIGLVNALRAVGRATYAALGPIGLLIIGVESLVQVVNAISPATGSIADEMAKVDEQFRRAWEDGRDRVEKYKQAIEAMPASPFKDQLWADFQKAEQKFNDLETAAQKTLPDMTEVVTTAFDQMSAKVNDKSKEMDGAVQLLARGVHDAMGRVATDTESASQKIVSALQGVIDAGYDPLINEQELLVAANKVANDKIELQNAKLTETQRAELTLQLYQDQKHWQELMAQQAGYQTTIQAQAATGFAMAGQAAIDGWTSKDPALRAAISASSAAIATSMQALKPDAAAYGRAIGDAFGKGIAAAMAAAAVVNAIKDALARIKRLLEAGSPPHSAENPLHPIDKWGEAIGQSYSGGIAAGIGTGDIAASLGGLVPAFGGAPAGGMAGAAAGGIHFHITGTVIDGPALDRFTRQIADRLRMAGV